MLDGLWDVEVEETSPAGSCSHSVTLFVKGSSVSFCDDESSEKEAAPKRRRSYFDGGSWGEMSMGFTPSRKAFTASQEVVTLPPWLENSSATLLGSPDVEGQIQGKDRASYSAVITVADPRGEILKIKHEARMTRRCHTTSFSESTELEKSCPRYMSL